MADPWSRTSPDRRWDYVIIGSGMGGMVAAALLSRLGKQVLLLEQHSVPGGYTHTFTRQGYRWDVGLHAVGEVTEQAMPGRLLAELTERRLEWTSHGPIYDRFDFPDDFSIAFPDRPSHFRETLGEAFPDGRRAVDEYLRRVRQAHKDMQSLFAVRTLPPGLASWTDRLARHAPRAFEPTTRQILDELTDDERLKTVLTAQWGYYGLTPRRSSFGIHALVVRHFLYGAFFPKGGSARVAEELLAPVAAAGGWTRVRADVEQIVVERGRACGVTLADGETIRARRVISAAGVGATVQRLLPSPLRAQRWAQAVSQLEPSVAHVALYLGFKGDIRAAGATSHNRWFWRGWDSELAGWPVAPGKTPEAPHIIYCSFPSLKDPAHDPGPEQRHTGEVVTFVPWQAFAPWQDTRWRRRPADYEELKQALQEVLLEQLLERLPALRPLVDYVELSTPLSSDHFCRPQQGAIYGLAPTPARFRCPWLRPRTPVRDLFFAGCDVASPGVIGAMMGGVLAVLSAEPVGAIRMLRRVW